MAISFRRMLRRLTGHDDPDRGRTFFFGMPTSGINVNEWNAQTYAPVWACVQAISETLSTLPWQMYKRTGDMGRELVTDHPLARTLKAPNPEMTGVTFTRQMIASRLIWGNAYAEIARDNAGRCTGLWFIPPDRVEIDRVDDRLQYRISNVSGGASTMEVILRPEDVLHWRGMSHDGLKGWSVIQQHREAIGLGLAAEGFGSSFYGNGAFPGGVIETPQALDQDGLDNLRASWNKQHQGSKNAFKTGILDVGMTWKPTSVPPNDAQYVELRQFQAKDIARIFRVPAHKIGILEDATFSNIEQQNHEFATDTILPLAIALETEVDCKCIQIKAQPSFFTKFNLDGLLRGDIESRYTAYATGRQWGWLSANDVRSLENMNPIDNGDIYLEPSNMHEAGEEPEPAPAPFQQPEPIEDNEQEEAAKAVLVDGLTRAFSKEKNAIRNAAKRDDQEEWTERFYGKHVGYVAECLRPGAKLMATLHGTTADGLIVDVVAERWCRDSREQLRDRWSLDESRITTCVEYMTHWIKGSNHASATG